jgi:outer membrane cobalamin receptor
MILSKTVCIAILFWLPLASLAQSVLDSTLILNEITVVADRYREVIPSQRLSGRQLEALSSFSVADAVRYFSGVQIKDYGGIGGLKTIDIRSMGSNHMGVFYDGIQLGNAQNGQVDMGKFSLDNIEEITLYNGQKSEIFQSAKDFGSAGTIYLRTRRPRFTDGEHTRLSGILRSGSFDLVNPSALWEQKVSDKVAAIFNIESIYSSGKFPFRYRKVLPDKTVAWDTTAIRQNGDIRSLRLEGGLDGRTSGDAYWHAKAYFYDSGRGIPGAIVNNVWKRSQRQWDRNFFVQGDFVKTEGAAAVHVKLKYANDWMRYLNPDTTLMYIHNRFRQQEIYASIASKYSLTPNWDVNLSVDYQWNTLHANLKNFAFPTRNTALVALATAWEWRRLKAQASWLGTFVFERVKLGNTPDDKQEYTPAVFLSYQPFIRHPFNFRAFYKHIFRMPTFNDLYYTDIGNIKLDPEYTVQYNIGFQYDKAINKGMLSRLNLRADAYYNEVTDKIVAVPKGNGQYRWMMMNLGYVEIRGIDVSAQADLQLPSEIRIRAGLNYTFQKAQDLTNPAGLWYGGQIAYIPWHNGSAIVNLTRRSWDLNYSFIYVGERYHASDNIPLNHEQPWYTHDLTIGKDLQYKKYRIRIAAEVNNLLNQFYDVIDHYPMPGRNFKIILKLSI